MKKVINKVRAIMKTKTIRIKLEDAQRIEQAARQVAVELERDVAPSELVHELLMCLEDAKKSMAKKNKN